MPPVQPTQPVAPVVQTGDNVVGARPMIQQVEVTPEKKKDIGGLIKTIALIGVSLVAVTFIGLFIWMSGEYNDIQENIEGQINSAVAEAKDEQAVEMEKEFFEREQYPYKIFLGPAEYGQLSFEYPKTWSVYVAEDASNGGDFEAYLNPDQVYAVDKETINALRVIIKDKSFDDVASEYQEKLEGEEPTLTVESISLKNNEDNTDIVANLYSGVLPGTELNGYIVIFKIRDKTVVLQTDSVSFKDIFDKILTTIKFNA